MNNPVYYVHRRTGRRIKMLTDPNYGDYAEFLYLDQNGPIRKGRKMFDRRFLYDYQREEPKE